MSRKKNTETTATAEEKKITPETPVEEVGTGVPVEEPKKEEDVLEETKAEEPADEESVEKPAEVPEVPEEPKKEAKVEEPVPEEAKVEEPVPEEAKVEEPASEAPVVVPEESDGKKYSVKILPNGTQEGRDKIEAVLKKLDVSYVKQDDGSFFVGQTYNEDDAIYTKKYLIGKGLRAFIE